MTSVSQRLLGLFVAALLVLTGCEQALVNPGQTEATDKPTPEASAFDQTPEVPAAAKGASNPGEVIPGRYIVVFHEGVSAPSLAPQLVAEHGGTMRHTYSRALSGFAAELSASAADELSRHPSVAFVEPDRRVRLRTDQTGATWGLDRVDQRNLPLNGVYSYTPTGAGVIAYIIDTGIRISHNDFGSRASHGYDAVGDGQNGNDCHGHGTHVAGTVGGTTWGVAKAVSLVAVRVLDCAGSGAYSDVIAGVDYVTGEKQASPATPMVANMSLGGPTSTSLDNAINTSIGAGVTYVVAAGNSNVSACTASPARVDAAITVGSTTSSDARSSFSNYGSCVDIFAPGSSITSAWYTSNTATNTISGTSMASPHVAGVAALYLDDNPSASPATVFAEIIATGTSGVVSNPGSGSPNLLVYSPLTTDGGSGGGGGGCTGYDESYTGTLTGTGDEEFEPNGTYYYSGSGLHEGCLSGPASTDFDLYLWKWNGWTWTTVASSLSATSEETISYNGSSGYYAWRIYSYSGSGDYDFGLNRP